MTILADSNNLGCPTLNFQDVVPEIFEFEQNFADNLLNYGRHLNERQKKFREKAGSKEREGTRQFDQWFAEQKWLLPTKLYQQAMAIAGLLDSLPKAVADKLQTTACSWETLVELTKTPFHLLEQAIEKLAELGGQTLASLKSFLKSLRPSRYLVPDRAVTEGDWQMVIRKLALCEGQAESLREKAKAIALDRELTTDQLLVLLNGEGYDGNSLLPPPKKKTYTPSDIAAIEQKAKAEALAQFQQQFTEQLEQIRQEAAQKQQESDRQLEQLQQQWQQERLESDRRIQQLEQQIQILLQRGSAQQSDSTVGAQALAALLQPTGESHRAVTVSPSTAKREFPGSQHNSSQKVKTSQKTPSFSKGFGQSVNQKHRRHG